MQYLLAHDLGTSGDKASLFTVDGTLVKSVVASYPCSYGSGNCVEQNPDVPAFHHNGLPFPHRKPPHIPLCFLYRNAHPA